MSTAEHLWLAVAVSGVALGLRGGLPLVGAAAPFAVGAVATALLDGVVPLPVAAILAVLVAGVAGLIVGLLLARADVVGRAIAGLALAALVERILELFPLGAGGASDVAVRGRLVSPSLGVSWRLSPQVLWVFALLAAAMVVVALVRFRLGQAELDLIRSGPASATAVGIDVDRDVIVLSGVCGVLLGAGGAGYLVCAGAVGPSDVGVQLSLQLFACGLAARAITSSCWGAFVAVAALWGLEQAVADRVAIGIVLLVVAALGPDRLWRALGHSVAVSDVPASQTATEWAAGAGGAAAGQSLGPRLWRAADLPAASQSRLQVEGLSATYGARAALVDVSLELRPGEVHALVGANGSGKTTLLRAVCGAIPSTGLVRLDGQELTGREPSRVRAGVARTLQLGAVDVDPRLAARVRDPRGSLLRIALGGSDEATWPASEGPTRLRSAVATGADVLLLDELGGGSDTEAAITALAARGHAVLIVEHDLAVVRRLATVTSVLDQGRVIASGPTAEVLDAPHVRAAFSGVEA